MCFSLLDSAIVGCGLATRVRFCPLSSAAQLLRAAVPYGKIVIVAEEGEGFTAAERLRKILQEFRPVSVILGRTDKFEGMFSLSDEVRAAVGIGERGALAARFFATVRGGYSLAIPLAPYAGGIFEPTASANSGWGGYPLRAADYVLADAELLFANFAEGLAQISLAAICAEDLAVDAVFSAERKEFDLRTPADLAVSSDLSEEGAKQLFCAAALFSVALRGAPAFACTAAAAVLNGRTLRPVAECRLALLGAFARRYLQLFEMGQPRPYFVPDYVGRAEACALWAGADPKRIFKNVRVPTAAESFRRAEVFAESRKKLCTSAQLLAGYAERFCAKYCAAGGVLPRFAQAELEEAYCYAPELTPLLSPPVLEREFGMLPCGAVCSARMHGKN